MASPADVDKYLKVKKLAADGATPGERATAQKILDRMEAEDPTIKMMADLFENPSKVPSGDADHSSSAPWHELLNLGKSAFENLTRAVSHTANIAYAGRLAEHVEVGLKQSEKTGNVVLTFRFPAAMLEPMWELSPVQQTAFRNALQAQLDEALAALLQAPNEADPDL